MFTKEDAEAYFNAEKTESLLFVFLGIAAISVSLYLIFFHKQPVWKGIAWPFLVIGLIQLVVGFTVYSRSDLQRKDIVYKMDMNPAAIQSTEIPRMKQVMHSFRIYRYTEIGLLLAGVVFVFLFRSDTSKQIWVGIGMGLAFQAVIMLVADGFAEKRGNAYLSGLINFVGKNK